MPDISDKNNPMIVPLYQRAALNVTGDEALDFLNDLLTLNIAQINPHQVLPTALLTPQGRILFDLLISQIDHGYRLECDIELLPVLVKKLRLYRMRRQVEIAPCENVVIAAYGAVDGSDWLADTRFSHAGAEHQAWRRYDKPSAQTSAQTGADMMPEHSVETESYRAARYRLAIAEGAREMPTEKALPLEARLDDLGAISFDKGCFIGQEVTARTRYRGLLKRRYVPIRAMTDITVPADIRADERLAGELLGLARTGDSWIGLANIRLDALDSGQTLMAGTNEIIPLTGTESTTKA